MHSIRHKEDSSSESIEFDKLDLGRPKQTSTQHRRLDSIDSNVEFSMRRIEWFDSTHGRFDVWTESSL